MTMTPETLKEVMYKLDEIEYELNKTILSTFEVKKGEYNYAVWKHISQVRRCLTELTQIIEEDDNDS